MLKPTSSTPLFRPRAATAPAAAATAAVTAALLAALALSGCDRAPSSKPPVAPEVATAAEAALDALAAACARAVEARQPTVQPTGDGRWTVHGYSAALVQRDVTATESPVTPLVGKIVVKDNEAQATAPTEADARAIILAPAHLVANRTHTFIYRFDGQRWQWANGSRTTKAPTQSDTTVPLERAELAAPGSDFAACLPQ
ncbi:hypothetical protein [Acidovorax sp. M2(2025)]|uniref:hypothetical protein n=1 Tax=Acidovorax sp. M2(2025) TaxID=3411355 RepID=UPI003BF4E69D